MIRVTCPKCQKKLGLEDAAAGLVVACPVCKHKFRAPKGNVLPATEEPVEIARKVDSKRVPVVKTEADELPVADVVSVAPEPVPVATIKPVGKDAAGGPAAPPPEIPASSPDSSAQTYGVTADPEPPPKPKKRPKPDEDEEELSDADVGLSEEYLKRRRQKKKQAEAGRLIPGINNGFLFVLVLLIAGGVIGGLVYWKKFRPTSNSPASPAASPATSRS